MFEILPESTDFTSFASFSTTFILCYEFTPYSRKEREKVSRKISMWLEKEYPVSALAGDKVDDEP